VGAAQIIVTAAGLLAIAAVGWFFCGPRGDGVAAATSSSGYQEAMILVKGAYTADVIVVEHGSRVPPPRNGFLRRDHLRCVRVNARLGGRGVVHRASLGRFPVSGLNHAQTASSTYGALH
jgi:plastocyanin domain-containing protein